jgi:hypothetical protein
MGHNNLETADTGSNIIVNDVQPLNAPEPDLGKITFHNEGRTEVFANGPGNPTDITIGIFNGRGNNSTDGALLQGRGLLPNVDMTGFGQEMPHTNHEGEPWYQRAWEGLKNLNPFGSKETVHDRVSDLVTKQMTPEERKQYEEQKDAYNSEWMRKMTEANINGGGLPDINDPKYAMLKEHQRRVDAMEKEIAEEVRASMSPADRERLDAQFKEYGKALDEHWSNDNPYGTGGGFRPLPQPGNAIKDYFDRIGEAVERREGRAAA